MVWGSGAIALTALVSLFLCAPAALAAPPANDDFTDLELLGQGVPANGSGSNVDATSETGEPVHAGAGGGNSVWYSWTAEADRRIVLETCLSDFDTVVAVYTGSSVGALQQVAANDDSEECADGQRATVRFDAVAGQSYRIAVDGESGETGSIFIDLHAAPVNDDFADATELDAESGLGQIFNAGASREPGEPRHAGHDGARSLWYIWRPAHTGTASFGVCSSDFESLLAVYTGQSISNLTEVASSDHAGNCEGGSAVQFEARAGESYRIAVDSQGSARGEARYAFWQTRVLPTLFVPDVNVVEPEADPTIATVTASLDRSVERPVEVAYETASLTAESGDFEPITGTLTFAPGQTVAHIPVLVNPDDDDAEDERIAIDFSGPDVRIGRAHTVIYVYDNDLDGSNLCNRIFCLRPGFGPLRASSSGASSELRKTIPITRGGEGYLVMRVGSRDLGEMGAGDSIEASAEVEVSLACVHKSKRCFGSRYRYSPKVKGKLVLGPGRSRPAGRKVARTRRLRCSQALPHRNHHCVLVFDGPQERLEKGCEGCHLKLVLSAIHQRAKRGDRLVVGSDATSGIEQGRGRINGVISDSWAPEPEVIDDHTVVVRKPRVANRRDRRAPRQVIYSARLDGIKEWEQIAVEARSLIRTSQLPYGTFVGSHLVISRSRRAGALKHIERDAANHSGEITEKNGFNCTRGRSGHSSPCWIEKVGVIRMKRDAEGPLWVNLVVELGARFGGHWHKGDRAQVMRGSMRIRRYGQDGWVSVVPTWLSG